MDVNSTPISPETNEQLADAAPTPHEPPTIRREDYRPFPWLVPEVSLDFDLGLEKTRVTSRLTVVPNAKADAAELIRLNGDGAAPLSVAVDGEAVNDWAMDQGDLMLPLREGPHEIEVVTEFDPSANTQLEGLYASNGMLCTQCEAEGFRRITFFPDRPDVLSTYRVRMSGDRASFPILLCNGNQVDAGEGADGTHWAEWHDPWPKPSYLFALVAGDLVANSATFTTMGGREVTLNVWVREEDRGRTDHAVESLRKSMQWDEEVFGREYDLDLYNIVAVSDFNMGAMENKGLNVFNTKYVLADTDTATDADFDAVEGVIAHEYFHNWSGNRVTCRDWFQLSLKEGFTVLRDQLFSQDMQGEAVKRIEDVRILRAAQFPEDSGPLAHPIRPDSYREISNFYTATVYNKGAEVIRMMRVLAGEEAFRKGCDLYFERHDGEAATCEDFVTAIEDGAGIDLEQFRLWYSQAGTPKVHVSLDHEGETTTLHFRQEVPETPGQQDKQPMVIPLKLALYDPETGQHDGERLVTLTEAQQSFSIENSVKKPFVSINRGFTAPVSIKREACADELSFLAAHDDDSFARYEALQELATGYLIAEAQGGGDASTQDGRRAALVAAFKAALEDQSLDDSMRGELLILPGYSFLAEQVEQADPGAINSAREGLKAHIAAKLEVELEAAHERAAEAGEGASRDAKGARKLRTNTLMLLAAGVPEKAAELATAQYDAATNMTDRQGALLVLCGLDVPARAERLADFKRRYEGNALVTDKWFALQASSLHPDVIAQVKELSDHPDFTMANPNRVRSLYMAFAANPHGFHDASGEGYRLIADLIIALDSINPQTAARFVSPLGRWRRIEPGRAGMMKAQLERIAAESALSRDTSEQVSRSLG